MIAGTRLCERRELAGCLPVKPSAVHNHSSDGRPVPSDKLGGGMYNDIRSVFNGTKQIGRCEGIVHHQRNAVSVSHIGHRADVGQAGIGIADTFYKYGLGVLLNGLFKEMCIRDSLSTTS